MQLRKKLHIIEDDPQTIERAIRSGRELNMALSAFLDKKNHTTLELEPVGNSKMDERQLLFELHKDVHRNCAFTTFNGKLYKPEMPDGDQKDKDFATGKFSAFIKKKFGENDYKHLIAAYEQFVISFIPRFIERSDRSDQTVGDMSKQTNQYAFNKNQNGEIELIVYTKGPFDFLDMNNPTIIRESIPGEIEYKLILDKENNKFVLTDLITTNSVLRELIIHGVPEMNEELATRANTEELNNRLHEFITLLEERSKSEFSDSDIKKMHMTVAKLNMYLNREMDQIFSTEELAFIFNNEELVDICSKYAPPDIWGRLVLNWEEHKPSQNQIQLQNQLLSALENQKTKFLRITDEKEKTVKVSATHFLVFKSSFKYSSEEAIIMIDKLEKYLKALFTNKIERSNLKEILTPREIEILKNLPELNSKTWNFVTLGSLHFSKDSPRVDKK